MIYEIRTYRIKPGSLPEVEKRFGEAYEYRKKYSALAAFWHTEIGPLNEIIHIWPYQDVADRVRVRADAMKDANWPPKIQEFIAKMRSEIITPFPFASNMNPGTWGPYYEIRYYNVRPGTMPDVMRRWESKIGDRAKLSPVMLAGGVDTGEAKGFVHIWAYKSLDERIAIRNQARAQGVWPPPGGADSLLAQKNKIAMPAAFSPMK